MPILPRLRASTLALIVGLVLAVLARSGAAAAGDWEGVEPAIAIAADLATEGGRTRLTLVLSRRVVATTAVIERPNRAVVDMPEVNFQLPPELARRRVGIVTGLRWGLAGPGRSRIVVDLGGPATPVRNDVVTGADGAARLILEFARTDRDSFRRAARGREQGAEPATTGTLGPAARDRRPMIALDAGHGGADPGATAVTGEVEKDIVLAFAERLRNTLVVSGQYRVIMTRDQDVFVPLDERVRRARLAGADLFVSIHADSISSPGIRGATVYTGAERATDLESASLADRENASDAVAGLRPGEVPDGVSDILQDLTARETRGFSHRFARQLYDHLHPALRFSANPHREAGFRVLRAADIPSVLVELGYLSNARDVESLLSEGWRRRVATAMAGAVDRFFAQRTAGRGAAPVSP